MRGRELCRAGLLASLGLLVCACGIEPQGTTGAAPSDTPGPGVRPRNLIVLSIDTLRADHLGCYGYERDTSPALDAFAARGTLFEDAFTTASWTVPAHASLFTGLYPRSHGVDNLKKRLPTDAPTLAELVGAAGLESAAIVNVYFLGKHSTLSRGFGLTGQYPPKGDATGAAPRLFEAAESWIADRDQPFFLFLHCYDVHAAYQVRDEYAAEFCGPYDGPVDGTGGQLFLYNEGRVEGTWGPADARRLMDLYDAGIRQFDAQLAGFIEFMDERALLDDTLVVLTSDHGEAFLEHGAVMHGRTLYEEELVVPLIFAGAGVPAGRRVAGDVSLVDVLPTILARFALPVPEHIEGIDLAPRWQADHDPDAEDRTLFFETVGGLRDDAPQRALRSGNFKLYRDERADTLRLFDLAADPSESRDVATEHPALFERLSSELQAFESTRRSIRRAGSLSVAELESLRLLGYL